MDNDENTKNIIYEIRIVHSLVVLIVLTQLLILCIGFLGFIVFVDSDPNRGILDGTGSVPATGETDNAEASDRQVRP
jgi:hypothetical protein